MAPAIVDLFDLRKTSQGPVHIRERVHGVDGMHGDLELPVNSPRMETPGGLAGRVLVRVQEAADSAAESCS